MKILIADDSPVIRHAVSALLANNGIETVTAEDGIEAIQKFYAELPDLVLMDIQMPRMTGYVACRLLKEDWTVANIPVLILTAHDSAEDRYWSAKSGADGYLTKETLGEDLLSAIRSAYASRALSQLSGEQRTPLKLDEMDVLSRVTQLLDRKLFETTIVNDIVTMATRATDLDSTLEQTMFVIRRFVTYDLAGIAVVGDRLLKLRADSPVTRSSILHFRRLTSGHVEQLAAIPLSPEELTISFSDTEMVTDGEDDGGQWPSFAALALRSHGETVGVLALAAKTPARFPPEVLKTLRMVEHPIAAVLDSARNHQRVLQQEAQASLSSLYETRSDRRALS
ncbi:MAG: response regulator [Acidimicrobiia bacterium]|nr:response regulator [Acidimicrobiia bacterium]